MKGTRCDDKDPIDLQPGEYKFNAEDGRLWFHIGGHIAHVIEPLWSIVEEQDGTITVTPSIFINKGKPGAWHGYLERGVWRAV